MPANTYSDGFPLTPLEAIEFSYFLLETEKQEWREWLQSATIEQQNELVDILHSMWQDNQKQAVPSAFVKQQPVDSPQQFPAAQTSTPDTSFSKETLPNPVSPNNPQKVEQPAPPNTTNKAPEPQFQFIDGDTPADPTPQLAEVAAASATTPQFQDNFKSPDLSQPQVQKQDVPKSNYSRPQPPAQPPLPIIDEQLAAQEDESEQTQEHPVPEPIKESEGEQQTSALKKMANKKYSPNPILEDRTPPIDEFVYKNGSGDKGASNSDDAEDTQPAKSRSTQSADNQNSSKSGTRENRNQSRYNRDRSDVTERKNSSKESKQPITEERRKDFFGGSKLRESAAKNLLDDVYKTYQDSKAKTAQTSRDMDDKFAALLDRVMQVISDSDRLATYHESIIDKIIEVNDKVVAQAKEIQLLKNNTQSRGGVSLQDQVDEMRDDIERLNRDTRTMRIEQRRKYDEITSQLASLDADSFKQDKTNHIIDRLKSDVFQIQQKLNLSNPKPSGTLSNTTRSDYQSSSKNIPNRRSNSNSNSREREA
ncbi:MAG: hypothetical protein AAGF07_02545 [Patescibacteria group bacterium]